jgi:hypothetical protein
VTNRGEEPNVDPLLVLVLIVVAAVAGVWWWWRRRRPEPVEDEWVLPPDESGPAAPAASGSMPGERPPVFDREFLVNRDRTFDPTRWDNTPDAAPNDLGLIGGEEPPAQDDLPRFLDREFLERRQREKDAGPA